MSRYQTTGLLAFLSPGVVLRAFSFSSASCLEEQGCCLLEKASRGKVEKDARPPAEDSLAIRGRDCQTVRVRNGAGTASLLADLQGAVMLSKMDAAKRPTQISNLPYCEHSSKGRTQPVLYTSPHLSLRINFECGYVCAYGRTYIVHIGLYTCTYTKTRVLHSTGDKPSSVSARVDALGRCEPRAPWQDETSWHGGTHPCQDHLYVSRASGPRWLLLYIRSPLCGCTCNESLTFWGPYQGP